MSAVWEDRPPRRRRQADQGEEGGSEVRLLTATKTNTVTVGRAKTGEVGPKGLVSETETRDDRVSAVAAPSTIHYCYDDDGNFRKLTMMEMIAKGYFVIGRGPRGF